MATSSGLETNTFGVQSLHYYNIDHKTCFGPEVTYFRAITKMVGNENHNASLTEFNFNGHHHLFSGNDHLGFYPLGGINYSIESVATESESAFGINVGAVLHYDKKRWTVFAEVIHLTGKLSEESFFTGVFFTPGKSHPPHE